MASGVQGRSWARRFSSQPAQSSWVTARAVAPAFFSSARTAASFSSVLAPVCSRLSRKQGVSGSAGRASAHSGLTTSRLTSLAPASARAAPYRSNRAAGMQPPSVSMVWPAFRWSFRYCSTVGTPAAPACIDSISLPASWRSAWM